jgi:hypothetical protein
MHTQAQKVVSYSLNFSSFKSAGQQASNFLLRFLAPAQPEQVRLCARLDEKFHKSNKDSFFPPADKEGGKKFGAGVRNSPRNPAVGFALDTPPRQNQINLVLLSAFPIFVSTKKLTNLPDMKNFLFSLGALLCVLCIGPASAAEKPEPNYVDAATLTLVNKPHATKQPFHRVEVADYPDLSKTVRLYYTYSTGVAVVFRTDSRTISARWTTTDRKPSTHMTGLSQKGMDLYIKRDGEWVFAGIARPGLGADHKATLVEHMDGTEKECLLYLPLFDEVKTLEIGVDAGARIEAAPNPFRHRIVVIGSSITHGTGLSRPGMAYPAQLERATGFEFVNLGASGQCKMEQFFAHVAAACEADAFLFDSFSNPSAQQIEERLEPFVATIRAAHPTTPLIFLQTEVRESRNFNDKIRKFEDDKRAASEAGMQRLLKQDKNIYFLNPGMPLGDDHDATVDGVHPSDLGHGRILEVIRPQIVKILKKHDIR